MTPPVPGPREGLNAAVAAQIRAEAAAAQISDKALADKAGVNYASLRRWLGKDIGNERHIDVTVLFALADALEIAPDELVRRATQRMRRADVVLTDADGQVTSIVEAKSVARMPEVQSTAARRSSGKTRKREVIDDQDQVETGSQDPEDMEPR